MSAQRLNKVLVVDDDPVIAKSFDRVLSRQGYAVVTASDGEEALRKISTEQYDAVFADIKMPGMDGITVAERIKAQQPWMPVVIVSGYATVENEARARAAGVCAVMHKPLTPQMIEQSAREALHPGAQWAPASGPSAEAEQSVYAPDAALAAPAPAPAAAQPVSQPASQPAAAGAEHQTWPVLHMIAAPFIMLGALTIGPFVGLAALVLVPLWHFAKWLVARPTTQFGRWGRDIALFVAAPFLSIAYIVLLPFVGIGMFAWVGIQALTGRHPKTPETPTERR